jgi:hypothetical protein
MSLAGHVSSMAEILGFGTKACRKEGNGRKILKGNLQK